MSNTTVRPIPTLKGMFSVPRVTQGRNFLKENKISLRSLEKVAAEKMAAKEPVRPKWMPPLRRTASEVRETVKVAKLTKQQSQLEVGRNPRSRSQQHLANVDVPEVGERHVVYNDEQGSERCQSCRSQRNSASIGVQTEDIMDELYLANALKKCSIDGRSLLSYSQYQDEDEPCEQLPLSARSNYSKHQQFSMDELETMPLPELGQTEEEEAPLSARSRLTIASNLSNTSTKSKRRAHKLGSRDEVRLPRYLEKEKREKAEAKERLEARDPDCPPGHFLISEEERLTTLKSAQKRYESLVNELNHMPMSTQTLRVRRRKAEIDKELTTVEDQIRIYAKPKVYVLAQNSEPL